jgi:hypothetical protein
MFIKLQGIALRNDLAVTALQSAITDVPIGQFHTRIFALIEKQTRDFRT